MTTNLQALINIQPHQYWTVQNIGNKFIFGVVPKPRFVCRLSQMKRLAKVIYCAEKEITEKECRHKNDIKKAMSNVLDRYVHLYVRLNKVERIITTLVLWILGYRGNFNIHQIATRLEDHLIEVSDSIQEQAYFNARKVLRQNPNVALYFKTTPGLKPLNDDFSKLCTIYFQKKEKFEKSLTSSSFWQNPAMLDTYNQLMELAYFIGCQLLIDAVKYQSYLKKQGEEKSLAQIITKEDSYFYDAFFILPRAYHNARGCAFFVYSEEEDKIKAQVYKGLREREAFYKPFYQRTTIQNRWRILFNSFCEDLYKYVPIETLKQAHMSFFLWAKPDCVETKYFETHPSAGT
jgi:hypothetical protein